MHVNNAYKLNQFGQLVNNAYKMFVAAVADAQGQRGLAAACSTVTVNTYRVVPPTPPPVHQDLLGTQVWAPPNVVALT